MHPTRIRRSLVPSFGAQHSGFRGRRIRMLTKKVQIPATRWPWVAGRSRGVAFAVGSSYYPPPPGRFVGQDRPPTRRHRGFAETVQRPPPIGMWLLGTPSGAGSSSKGGLPPDEHRSIPISQIPAPKILGRLPHGCLSRERTILRLVGGQSDRAVCRRWPAPNNCRPRV